MDMELPQHTDTVTGLCLSPNNNFLLSNSMDCSLLKWDMKPFITPIDSAYHPRCLQKYDGARHGAEKVLLKCSWSPDMDMVACGSADRYVFWCFDWFC